MPPPDTFQVGSPGGNRTDDAQSAGALEDSLRWKDVSQVRVPALPGSAGAFRAWRNAFLPMLMALDCSDQRPLYHWLLQAFNARAPPEIQVLRTDSAGFPRFDRVLCSWFIRDSRLKGHFGTRIPSYVEESIEYGG